MLKSYKYRIYPNKEQRVFIEKTFGCCRYVYNRALAMKMELYEKEKKGISIFKLIGEIPKWKKIEETKWLKEVNASSLQQSLLHLDKAYTAFFKQKKGFPKFKSKHNNRCSFNIPVDSRILNGKFFIPKLKTGINIILHRKFTEEIKFSTVSKTPTGKYFISILIDDGQLELKTPNPDENRTLGIDLGIANYVTDSNGNKVANPKHLQRKLKLLKRAQQRFSRKKKGSNNRNKQRIRLARIHEKVTNCRNDFLHKLTKKLVENQDYDSIAMENLDVAGMLQQGKKSKLSRYISDAGWGEFQRQLEYKCRWYGKNLLFIGQFDPSSKLCICGKLANITLKDREWTCKSCGQTHDRDILAANNIKRFAFCQQNTRKEKNLR